MASDDHDHASDKPGLQAQKTTNVATIDATLPPDLWQLAYIKFSEKDPDLVHKYERMLSKDAESPGNEDLQTKMSSILSRNLNRMASRQWSVKWKGKALRVRDQVDRIVKLVQTAKDFGSVAAGIDPIHAGIPWAGVSVLLQLFLNDSEEHKSALDNVESVAQIIRRYKAIECIYLPVARPGESPLRIELQDAVVFLYTKILSFQAKAALYFDHATIRRVAGNVAKLRDWPSLEKEIKSQDENCMKLCSEIGSAEQSRGIQNLESAIETMTTKFDEILKDVDRRLSEKANILDWLSTNRGDSDHEVVRMKLGTRYWESGRWLLEDPDYASWRTKTDTQCTLWLQGSVGTGKSSLVSIVVEDCLSRAATRRGENLAFFYCSNEDSKRNQPIWVLRSILAQLACHATNLEAPSLLMELYESSRKKPDGNDGNLTAKNCVTMLRRVTSQAKETVIIIDALDECEDPDELLLRLKEIEDDNSCRTRLLLSSRMHVKVSKIYESCIIVSTPGGNEADLAFYIRNEVGARKTRRLLDGKRPDLEARLIETLSRQAQGMFRWAELQLALFFSSKSRLRHSSDVETRLQALEKKTGLPELDSVYREIYEMNTGEGSESRAVAVRVFKWILSAYEPLELSELSYAAALRDDGVPDPEVNNDFVLDVCSNFVTIDTFYHAQFVHASVRDFLEDLKFDDWKVYSETSVNIQAAKTCLVYLTSSMFLSAPVSDLDWAPEREFASEPVNDLESGSEGDSGSAPESDSGSASESDSDLAPDGNAESGSERNFDSAPERDSESGPESDLDMAHKSDIDTGFPAYARRFWASHCEACKDNTKEDNVLRNSLLDFLSLEKVHPGFLQWHNQGTLHLFPRESGRNQSIGAHLLYKSKGWAMKMQDCSSYEPSPFLVACVFGFLDVVEKYRTEDQAMLNARNRFSLSSLCLACKYGHLDIVLTLLEKGASIDTKDRFDRTPLHFAVYEGDEALVRMLLEHGANVDATHDPERRPLLLAVKGMFKNIVQLLLRYHANPSSRDNWRRSCLWFAIFQEDMDIAHLLLKAGADVNSEDMSGIRPLFHAVDIGSISLVRMLLDFQADPNISWGGKTCLAVAIEDRREDIYQLLWEAGAR